MCAVRPDTRKKFIRFFAAALFKQRTIKINGVPWIRIRHWIHFPPPFDSISCCFNLICAWKKNIFFYWFRFSVEFWKYILGMHFFGFSFLLFLFAWFVCCFFLFRLFGIIKTLKSKLNLDPRLAVHWFLMKKVRCFGCGWNRII